MIENVNEPSFYYPYIIIFIITFTVLQILIYIFRSKDEHAYTDLSIEEKMLIQNEEFILKGKLLRAKYMWAYLLSKAAMWAKAPYTYMLFSIYYKFTIGEIGVLYLIDAVVSLICGPFLGFIADTFGRKIVTMWYPLNTVVVLLMRMSGNVTLAYLAQFMTGAAGGILSTSFESWLNYEINELYGENKNYIQHFRKRTFSRIIFFDSILSLVVTLFAAIVYNLFGIFFALSVSITLASLSFFVIMYTWNENKPNSEHKYLKYIKYRFQLCGSFSEGMTQLKEPQIFSLGIVDSFYYCSIQVLIFVWTPALQITAENANINPGMIFLIMILFFLTQNKMLEFLNCFHINYFYLSPIYLFLYFSSFFAIFFINDYGIRMVLLSFINVLFNFNL